MATLELYLIRHGVAAERGEEYPDDSKRPLTSDELDATRCPFCSKYSRNDERISLQVICGRILLWNHEGHEDGLLTRPQRIQLTFCCFAHRVGCCARGEPLADEIGKKALPGEMYTVFMHYKRDEWERYCATVTDWDVTEYLDVLP